MSSFTSSFTVPFSAHRRAKINDKHWNKKEVDDFVPKEGWFNPPSRTRNLRCETHMITMKDGVDICVDVIRPAADLVGGENAKLPCIFHQTRYYRQWRLRKPLRALESYPMDPINLTFKKAFTSAGFAIFSIDVRGTGASFGEWPSPCQLKEREDSVEILDWVAEQVWCDGNIYLYGISYDAMAALFTCSYKHANVKACAPLFTYWDVFGDLGAPGGVMLHYFFDNWNKLVHALDSSKLIEAPHPIGSSFVAGFKGVKGVSKGLVKDAISTHKTVDLSKCLRQVINRDDRPEALAGVTIDECSPFSRYKEIKESKIPFYVVGGWLDGSARSSINMFTHAVKGNGSRLLIGPWTHGGVQHAGLGPKQNSEYSSFHKVMKIGRSKLVAEVVKFFLSLGNDPPSSSEDAAITYFTMNAPEMIPNWRHIHSWPPDYLQDSVLYINADQSGLRHSLDGDSADTRAAIEFEAVKGRPRKGNSRFHTMIFVGDLLKYKLKKHKDHVLVDSKPLDCHLEITGTPYLDIWISSSDADADIIVYLENFDPMTGSVNYVTEGVFRARHRKAYDTSDCSGHYKASQSPDVPFWHTFDEKDAEPLTPKKPTRIMFEMMPTSYCFQKGSCLRLALSGCDDAHYLHKAEDNRVITLVSSPEHKSCIHLPNKVYR